MKPLRTGIKLRILLSLALIVVVTGGCWIAINHLERQKLLENSQREKVASAFAFSVEDINQSITNMESTAVSMSHFASSLLYVDNKESETLEQLISDYLVMTFTSRPESLGGGIWYEPFVFIPDKKWFGPYVFRQQGVLNFTWDLSSADYDYHNQDWYRVVFEGDTSKLDDGRYPLFWSEPYIDEAGSFKYMLTVAAPIYSVSAQVVGVTTVDWEIESLDNTLSKLSPTPNSRAFLLNTRYGQFWSFPSSPHMVMTPINQYVWGNQLVTLEADKIGQLDDVELDEQVGTLYYVPASRDIVIGLFIPQSDNQAVIRQLTFQHIVYSVAFLVLLLLLMLLVLQWFFRPISRVIQSINASVSFDEHSGQLKVTEIYYPDNNEFVPVVRALNRVYRQVDSYHQQLEKANNELQKKQSSLNTLNASLESKVKARTSELNEKNTEANRLLDELKQAQQHLVEMEKNSALSILVAGVAHELNTPLGVCMTANSVVMERLNNLEKALSSGGLTKSSLNSLIDSFHECQDVISLNLSRAISLIDNFKHVSSEHFYDECNEFSPAELVTLAVKALKPRLSEHHIEISSELDEQIIMLSYPVAFSQTVTNLLTNALEHGFEGKKQGNVHIKLSEEKGERVKMIFSDDGIGMSAQTVQKLYDPFFTTRRGKGGTGLGMHIVYNLVTQKMQGSIQVKSKKNQGTEFCIILPQKLSSKSLATGNSEEQGK